MTESVIDFPKDGLCPEIWEKGYDNTGTNEVWKLTAVAKEKILSTYHEVCPEAQIVHIIGSITSNQYTENGDVDLHFLNVGIEFHDNDELEDYRKSLQEKYQNKVFIGTHPIEVYYQDSEFQDYMSVGCYDVLQQKWIVGPELQNPKFNPYSEYYSEILSSSEKMAEKVRNMIFSIYEIAIVLKKNSGTEMQNQLFEILKLRLDKVKQLYDEIRQFRKVYSSPTSKEEALKYRSSRKWKIADAAFKLFDKYGYLEIMRKLIALNDILVSTDVSEEIATSILDTIKKYINNADKLSEQEMYEAEQLDEGAKEAISSFALALALLIPGVTSAKTTQSAYKALKTPTAEVQKKQNEFISMLNGHDPNKLMNGYKMWQALNILALTLYGEGRDQIKSNALDPIVDSILNRTAKTPDINRVANICVGRKEGRAFQYSFWNKNKNALATIKAGNPVLPKEIATNIIERKAWETCLKKAVEIITGNYVVQDKHINSYHVTDMPNPPTWSSKMTHVKYAGSHKFGYVDTNDPQIMDMATMTPIKGGNKTAIATYTVKNGDTLWKIAKQYNTTAAEIAGKNNIDINGILKPGQRLRI